MRRELAREADDPVHGVGAVGALGGLVGVGVGVKLGGAALVLYISAQFGPNTTGVRQLLTIVRIDRFFQSAMAIFAKMNGGTKTFASGQSSTCAVAGTAQKWGNSQEHILRKVRKRWFQSGALGGEREMRER